MPIPETADQKLAGTRWYFYQHPMVYRVYRETERALRAHARGRTLDLGAGRLTYRGLIVRCGTDIAYTSLDIERAHSELDVVADVCRGTGLPESSFDTVFCSQVLEHVSEPAAFLAEAYRLCAPGGRLIITAPFLFYVHGMPHDYFRYTPDGLAHLASGAGFRIVESRGVGGLIAFLSMIPFTAALHVFRFLPVPLLSPFFAAAPPIAWLDALLDTSARFPACSLLVAEK